MRGEGWASSMAARVFALLVVGITAASLLAFTLSDLERRTADGRSREQRLADRVVDFANVLDRAPAGVRPDLFGDGPEGARLAPADAAGTPDAGLTQRLAARLPPSAHPEAQTLEGAACRNLRPGPPPPPLARDPAPPRPPPPVTPAAPDCRLVSLILSDGERLRLLIPAGPRPPHERPTPFSPILLAVLALAAAALALITSRIATAPLQRLSQAAGALGRDLDRPPLVVEGPLEVRRAAAAFNVMQSELKRREAERTHMLAAITHDLQTPLTRLRLRLEKVADPDLRQQLLADQAAMVGLVRDGLDLARFAGDGGEPLQALDVDSLLESLCADAVDAGEQVRVIGLCGRTVLTRPQALKRCVANLLDNALKHAGSADLSAQADATSVTLRVLDRGAGIPADRLEDVFQPFVRLETSRSRETGGVGLGLTIAKLLATKAEARLTLSARAGGGLEAAVVMTTVLTARVEQKLTGGSG